MMEGSSLSGLVFLYAWRACACMRAGACAHSGTGPLTDEPTGCRRNEPVIEEKTLFPRGFGFNLWRMDDVGFFFFFLFFPGALRLRLLGANLSPRSRSVSLAVLICSNCILWKQMKSDASPVKEFALSFSRKCQKGLPQRSRPAVLYPMCPKGKEKKRKKNVRSTPTTITKGWTTKTLLNGCCWILLLFMPFGIFILLPFLNRPRIESRLFALFCGQTNRCTLQLS